LVDLLSEKVLEYSDISMLARTHGQPASPTRLGKEVDVFRVRIIEQLKCLHSIPLAAKFGGATGNFNAHIVAFPKINWKKFATNLVSNLGLYHSFPTTQIEHYDHLASLFDCLKRINTIIIDFNRDIWSYISMDYFKQKINKNEVAALKIFLGSSTGDMLVDNQQILRDIFLSTDLIIVVHSEDEQIINENLKKYKIKYNSNIPFDCHSKIRSEEACLKSTKKIIKLAKETNARLHVFHLSTKLESLLFQNDIPLKEKKITSEVCVHHLWFSDKDYKDKQSFIKWNPAIKTEEDRDGLWDSLLDDRIDVIATDHAPHTLEEKSKPYLDCPSGGPLVQHALVSMIQHHLNNKISLEKIVTKMCHNPAILFQISKRGYVREGYYADLVLIDINKSWTVNKDNILYKCNWSPFEGVQFDSKITHTIVNGKIVYENGLFNSTLCGKKLTFNR
jgi:dihydroorotase